MGLLHVGTGFVGWFYFEPRGDRENETMLFGAHNYASQNAKRLRGLINQRAFSLRTRLINNPPEYDVSGVDRMRNSENVTVPALATSAKQISCKISQRF